jgi:chitin biosynthesis protein CHS5
VLEWDPIDLATADLLGLALYRNGQKAGAIPRPLQMHSTKISGLAVDTEYTFHLVLRTSAGTFASERVKVRTHKMTDLSGVTITTGILPPAARESLAAAVERIGARLVDSVRIDTTHFVTTEGRGIQWEKAVEMNIPVVRPEWVEACEKNGRILGVTKFYLDALRPGPPSPNPGAQDQPAQAAPLQRQPSAAKELPTPPNASSQAEEAPTKPKERDEAVSGDEDEEEDEAGGSAENKVRSPAGGEQKVRFDDKEKENLAYRPKPTVEDEDGEADGRDGKEPDGASFQDVQL